MKFYQLVFLLLGVLGELITEYDGLKLKGDVGQRRGRMLSRGRRVSSPSLETRRPLPSRKAYQQHTLEETMLGGDGSDFISDTTIGGIIHDKSVMSKAPSKPKTRPISVRTQAEGAGRRVQVTQRVPQGRSGRASSVVRSISPRRISVIDLNMGPQEMVGVLSQEARRLEQDKTGVNKGSAELACGRYSFMFHCEVIEIPRDVLEKRKDKYLYTVSDSKNKIFAWNTAQGTYGRVVFGYIEVPTVEQKFKTGISSFSEFYKLPDVLTGVKVLFHGGGKYPARYLLPGMKVSVAIKSYFRGLFKIGRVVWNREREILYSLSKEFWTDGHGGPLTHTPTVFSVHYQDPVSGKQKVLFEDQENRRALVSELLIMERITGQTFFEVLVYLQDSRIFEWLEKTNAWELWYKAIYKLQWTLNHIMQSFMTTGYVLYMHCDLNRSNILLSIPPLTLDHKRNLLNIISMEPWDVRLIDLSFVWVPSALKSRNTRSICSQVNKAAIFSDANYLYVCIIELLKTPQKDLPINRPSPLYKTVRSKALEFWERLESINEWWAVGVNFIGRNSSTHTRYKIRRPDLGGNTFNECIEGIMLMSDAFDAEAKALGIRLPFNSFSPESYLRGYLHLSFRISRLGLCLRTKVVEHWVSLKSIISPVSYFDFSVMVLSLDASISSEGDSGSCKVSIPKPERQSSEAAATITSSTRAQQGSHYTTITLPGNVCQEIKSCMASVEAMRSIPGDEVIKPAISVVTAENHESDSILQELRNDKLLPESIQALGVRLMGRFQGINSNVDLSKEQIINFLQKLDLNAKIGTIRSSNPSESSLLSVCNGLERNGTLNAIFGAQKYASLVLYAKNYRLTSFCQLLFKQLRHSMLFTDGQDSSFRYGSSPITEKANIMILPSRRRRDFLDNTGKSVKESTSHFQERGEHDTRVLVSGGGFGQAEEIVSHKNRWSLDKAISSIQGIMDQIPGEVVYLISSKSEEGLRVETLGELIGSNRVNIRRELRERFTKRIYELVNSVGEDILRYNSIQLFCSSFSELFECKMNAQVVSGEEEDVTLELDRPADTTRVVLWDEVQNKSVGLQWKVLSGKYGSVAFAAVRIPKASSEYFVKSQTMMNSCNMPLKMKNVRVWFHGSQRIEPGWVPESMKLFLAIKSPFRGVHSLEKEIWERENLVSLLLNREQFSMVMRDGGEFNGYQISPSIITFHNNVKDVNKSPLHFFVQGSKKNLIKLNDPYRPLFSSFLFMEYIDGVPLEALLYYLRSEEMYTWLNQQDGQKSWSLWLEAILNLSRLVLLSIQSFSSSGFFQYFHCDLNFGNIIILKDGVSGSGESNLTRLLQDRRNHLENLKFLANIGQDSIRIIDFAFTNILHHRETDEEFLEIRQLWKTRGVYKILSERNFENTCKKMIKAALFNDPNYVSILISELIIGSSSLLNKSLMQDDSDPNVLKQMVDPSLKWKDLSNPYIGLLVKLDSTLNSAKEWEVIAQEFIQDENPVKRWISKSGKTKNQRNVLSSFNQGSEAYLIACEKLNQMIQIAKKAGLITTHTSILGRCLSFEFYLRSILFLPYNLSKTGSCLYSKAKKSHSFASFANSEWSSSTKITFFQLASITISYYIWTQHKDNITRSLFLDQFFQEIQGECNPQLFDSENPPTFKHLQNIDQRFEKTKDIYTRIYKEQLEFLNNSILKYRLSIPFALLLQRTWFRIQDSTELLRNQSPLHANQNILNSLLEFFKSIQSTLSGSNDPPPQLKNNLLHLTESSILDTCINNNSQNHSYPHPVIHDSTLSHPDFCKFIIKPTPHTSTFDPLSP
ncbi:hypothetical protein OJ252_123 [Cryptosporidium canis]|uniref:Protein kinase domain-containing protein n=1 Tax=Cryptosporidium canis TaxID=195482 RepID=A0ABQ8PBY3_9CRYT|nr:hypothetical protein OJ252_123 [Cryptosporidium canis]